MFGYLIGIGLMSTLLVRSIPIVVTKRTYLYRNAFLSMKKNTPTLPTIPKYKPKTENQKKYMELIQEKSLVVALGPAGSGKTLLACVSAIEMLQKGEIKKIILTRPMITVEDEEVGFLPGDLNTKMNPWTKPMLDIFSEYYTMQDILGMIQSEKIEVCPLAFMRGRTFHDSFIIADEMQNSSPTQILMLSTRIGEKSKMVIMGDLHQSDSKMKTNGLSDFLDKYNKRVEHEIYGIGVIQLEGEDILRSKLVSQILKLYSKDETNIKQNNNNYDCALIPKDQYNPL
jgi:phosphate starvation-inducible PhoH-like protein